jgi:hypothetical protein
MSAMTIEVKPMWQVLKQIRGEAIPAGRTIESLRDKIRRRERRAFRQNRLRMEW